jgi:hypothetical protein
MSAIFHQVSIIIILTTEIFYQIKWCVFQARICLQNFRDRGVGRSDPLLSGFAVLLIPLRITALSEAGFAYKQSIRSFSTSASPSSDGASSPVSPLGRSHPTEQMQQRYCQSHNNGTMANNCEDIMISQNFITKSTG